MKKSCVIYATWADQILNLPDDIAGEYIKYILRYAIYGEESKPDNPFLAAMLVPVKKKLDEDHEVYKEICRKRSEAGKKGMEKRWNITSDNKCITSDNGVNQSITPITDTDTDTDTDKKYIKKNPKKKSTFHDFPERTIDFKALAGGSDV